MSSGHNNCHSHQCAPPPQSAKPQYISKASVRGTGSWFIAIASQAFSWPGEAAWTTVTSMASGNMAENCGPLRRFNPESDLFKRDPVARRSVQGLSMHQHKLQVLHSTWLTPTGHGSMATSVTPSSITLIMVPVLPLSIFLSFLPLHHILGHYSGTHCPEEAGGHWVPSTHPSIKAAGIK